MESLLLEMSRNVAYQGDAPGRLDVLEREMKILRDRNLELSARLQEIEERKDRHRDEINKAGRKIRGLDDWVMTCEGNLCHCGCEVPSLVVEEEGGDGSRNAPYFLDDPMPTLEAVPPPENTAAVPIPDLTAVIVPPPQGWLEPIEEGRVVGPQRGLVACRHARRRPVAHRMRLATTQEFDAVVFGNQLGSDDSDLADESSDPTLSGGPEASGGSTALHAVHHSGPGLLVGERVGSPPSLVDGAGGSRLVSSD